MKVRPFFVVSLFLCCFIAFIVHNLVNAKGFVTVPGYEHGVASCSEEYQTIIHLPEAHIWAKNGVMYVVNGGHIDDPEVQELVEQAEHECAQYFKE